MTQSKAMLTALVLCLALFTGRGAARAQCSAGDYLGTCDSAIGFAGCCPTASSIMWCEGALLCGIDCSGNQGFEDCCGASDFGGCSNAAVEECVCGYDDFCCDVFGAWDELCVGITTNDCGACGAGGAAANQCGWLETEGFYECRESPSADPTGAAPRACPTCAPACAGKDCGDDGCGGSCGSCGAGESCQAGQCVTTCAPQCAGKTCGDDGCGGVCGQCLSTQTCVAGHCQAQGCAPQCAGRECGSDGCLGTCGSCATGEACVAGQCEATCVPDCGARECGADGGGGSCGTCGADETCEGGACVAACSCEGRECGDDGCGRTCGFCVAGTRCDAATHLCAGNDTPVGDKTEVIGSENCPPGQVWNAYASACVVDTGGFVPARAANNDGCAGAAGSLGAALLAVAGLFVTAPRSRTRRGPTR